MKSKPSSAAALIMPDSEIRVGIEAAKKPMKSSPKKADPKVKMTGKMPEMSEYMQKRKNIPKRKK
jgi:hypothetical protein